MKILIYSDFYKDASGFAKEVKDIIPGFLKAGHDVRQVGLKYNGLVDTQNEIHVYPTRIQGPKSYWSPEVLDFAIEDFQPDIILTIQDYFVNPYLSPALSRPRKKPFKWVHWGLADGEPILRGILESNTWVHYHIFQSEFAKNALENSLKKWVRSDVDFSKNEVIYPSVDTNIFKPLNKNKCKEELKLKDKFVLSFIARNQFRKNVPCLLEAVKKLIPQISNIMLLFRSIETVTPEQQKEGYDIAAIVKDLGILDYVADVRTAEGKMLSDKSINKLYNASDIFVLPTMGEGFGLCFTEAMAAKVPCVGTNYSAVPEVLGDGRGYLVNPDSYIYAGGETKHAILNSDKLANAIYKVYKNPILRRNMVKKSYKWIQDLTPEMVSNKLLKVFTKVLKEDKQPLAIDE